jgi:hypothetical protein
MEAISRFRTQVFRVQARDESSGRRRSRLAQQSLLDEPDLGDLTAAAAAATPGLLIPT